MNLDPLEPRGKRIPPQATAQGRMQHRLRVARKIYAAACAGLNNYDAPACAGLNNYDAPHGSYYALTDEAVRQHGIGYRLLAGTIQDVHQHLYASGRTAIPPRRLCHDE